MRRPTLAFALFAPLLAVGSVHCAATSADASGASSAADTTCSDAAYQAWLASTLKPALRDAIATPSDANIAALESVTRAETDAPCASDASYLAWYPYFGAVWSPIAARAAALRASFATLPTPEQWETRSITANEERLIAALHKSAPAAAEARAYATWQALYIEATHVANATLYSGTVDRPTRVQDAWTVDAREDATLKALEATRPTTTALAAYGAWLDAYATEATSIERELESEASSPGIEARLQAAAARFVSVAPPDVDQAAYGAWFEKYSRAFEPGISTSATGLESRALAVWTLARPTHAGGDSVYKAWLGLLLDTPRLDRLTGAAGPAKQAQGEREVAALLAVKPCAGAAAETLRTTTAGRVAAQPRLVALLEAAKTEACAAP